MTPQLSSNTRHYKLISWAGDVAQLVKTCPEWSSNSTYIHRTPVIPVLENGDRRTRSSRSSLATKHTWDQSGIQETCLKKITHTHTHTAEDYIQESVPTKEFKYLLQIINRAWPTSPDPETELSPPQCCHGFAVGRSHGYWTEILLLLVEAPCPASTVSPCSSGRWQLSLREKQMRWNQRDHFNSISRSSKAKQPSMWNAMSNRDGKLYRYKKPTWEGEMGRIQEFHMESKQQH